MFNRCEKNRDVCGVMSLLEEGHKLVFICLYETAKSQ